MDLSFNIDIPNEKILNNVHEMSKNNYFLYYYINKHQSIDSKLIKKIEVTEDGNCYYNSLSIFFNEQQL